MQGSSWTELIAHFHKLLANLEVLVENELASKGPVTAAQNPDHHPCRPPRAKVAAKTKKRQKPHNRGGKRIKRKAVSVEAKKEAKKAKRLARQRRTALKAKEREQVSAARFNSGVLFDIAPHFSMHRSYIDFNTGLLAQGKPPLWPSADAL